MKLFVVLKDYVCYTSGKAFPLNLLYKKKKRRGRRKMRKEQEDIK